MIDTDRKSDVYPPTVGEVARLSLQTQAAGEPIALSVNGRGSVPIADPRSIQRLVEFVEELETLENLRQSIRSVEEGAKTYSLEEIARDLKAQHGVSKYKLTATG